MDIVLERILSLIPKKENGKYVHGAKKDFAMTIGYDSGDIVSMWIKGTSNSYLGKLHEISNKYNVSVEWLEGKSDIKEKAAPISGSDLSEKEIEFFKKVDLLNPAMQRLSLACSVLDEEEIEHLANVAEMLAKAKGRL